MSGLGKYTRLEDRDYVYLGGEDDESQVPREDPGSNSGVEGQPGDVDS